MKWRECKDRLPRMSDDKSGVYAENVLCLVTTTDGVVHKAAFNIKRQIFRPFTGEVIAWQPLPKAYEGE